MRTVKRKALPPNAKKQTDLEGLCQAYTREKQRWLQHFQCWKRQPYLERPRTLRDEMVKQGYRSPNQLQARHWKLALNDAAETWDKYWQSIFVKVRLKISHQQVNPAYGSQSCPFCEFVDSRNRKGDRFQCLHCGHENASDRIAAQNYARRFGDPKDRAVYASPPSKNHSFR